MSSESNKHPSLHKIGLIMGLSPESSLPYYKGINDLIRERLGGHASAPMVMESVDFSEITAYMSQGQLGWSLVGLKMAMIAKRLEDSGAGAIAICSNTIHQIADEVEKSIQVPLIHIADCTAQALRQQPVHRVALLGTKITATRPFLIDRLHAKSGLEIIVPRLRDCEVIDRIIFEELCRGQVKAASVRQMADILVQMRSHQHIDGVILGCTELGLAFDQNTQDAVNLLLDKHDPIQFFDTTAIHVAALANFCIDGTLP